MFGRKTLLGGTIQDLGEGGGGGENDGTGLFSTLSNEPPNLLDHKHNSTLSIIDKLQCQRSFITELGKVEGETLQLLELAVVAAGKTAFDFIAQVLPLAHGISLLTNRWLLRCLLGSCACSYLPWARRKLKSFIR